MSREDAAPARRSPHIRSITRQSEKARQIRLLHEEAVTRLVGTSVVRHADAATLATVEESPFYRNRSIVTKRKRAAMRYIRTRRVARDQSNPTTVAIAKPTNTGRTGRTTSHAQQPGQTTAKAQQPGSGDDPPDEPAPVTPGRREALRRKAAVLEFRAAMAGGITVSMLTEVTRGMRGDERDILLRWLPVSMRDELAADLGRVA